jgi:hypothetical protein
MVTATSEGSGGAVPDGVQGGVAGEGAGVGLGMRGNLMVAATSDRFGGVEAVGEGLSGAAPDSS